jgi:membrane-associated phospholipid phosphatase
MFGKEKGSPTETLKDKPSSQVGATRRSFDLFMMIIATGIFAASALFIDSNHVSALETDAFRWINGFPEIIFRPVWLVMQLGNVVVVPAAAVIALILHRVRLAAGLALAGTLVWLLAKVVKQMVPRGRPGELLSEVTLLNAPAVGNGYISGHAAVAFALVAVASPYLSRWIKVAAWILATLVCLARVYVGAHLPLDVIGGAAFGIAMGSLANLALGVPSNPKSESR